MTLSSQRRVAGILTVLIASLSSAATPPPESVYGAVAHWKPVSTSKPTSGMRMGALDIQFEKTTLTMVAQAAGRGQIAHQGDAGDSIHWLCYTVLEAKYSKRVWLISVGGMGGREHRVNRIAAAEIPSAAESKDCPSLPDKLLPLSFGKNLRLGTGKSRALALLGRPSYHQDALWIFGYEGNVPGDCEPRGFLIDNWLGFEVEAERVVRIQAGQVTSC